MEIFIWIVILIVVAIIIYRANYSIVSDRCDWCSEPISMRKKDWRWYYRNGVKMYCSGRCKRADESSEGVKEKRYRIIDHE